LADKSGSKIPDTNISTDRISTTCFFHRSDIDNTKISKQCGGRRRRCVCLPLQELFL